MFRHYISIVFLLLLVFILTPVTDIHGGAAYDGRYYLAMAMRSVADPQFVYHPPWCWRVLTPYLVSLFPSGMELVGFQVLNAAAVLLTLLLLLDLFPRLGASKRASWVVTLLYAAVFWAFQSVFHFPVMVDAGGQLFVVWVLSLMVRGDYRLIPFVIFLGSFQKESIILLAPVVSLYWYCNGGNRKQTTLYLALLLFLALLPLGILKALIPGNVPYYPEAVLRMTFIKQAFSVDFWPRLLIAVFSGLGLFPLFMLTFPKSSWRYMKANPYLFVYLGLAVVLLFGGSGKSRLFLHALIPTGIVAAYLIDRFVRDDRAGNMWLVLVVALCWLVNFKFHGVQDHDIYRTWINPVYTSLTYGEPPVFVKLPLWYAYSRLGVMLIAWVVLAKVCKPFKTAANAMLVK